MVIGTGLVARNFIRYEALDNFLVFASGVSSSKSCTPEDFRREQELFQSSVHAHPLKWIVYFSTSSINDPDLSQTPYVLHKIAMEEQVRSLATRYTIFRLSNLAGFSDNASTILNFFYHSIVEGRRFELWKYSERNIIDVSDVYSVCDRILQNNLFTNQTVNIANPKNYAVRYIVECIEQLTAIKANFAEKEKGIGFSIDVSAVMPVYEALQIRFGDNYLPRILKKYYSKK